MKFLAFSLLCVPLITNAQHYNVDRNQTVPCPPQLKIGYDGCVDTENRYIGPGRYIYGQAFYENGIKNGDYIQKNPDPQRTFLIVKGQFKDDAPIGDWYIFSEKSTATYKISYVNGVLKEVRFPDNKKTLQIEPAEPTLVKPNKKRIGRMELKSFQPFEAPIEVYRDAQKTKVSSLIITNYTFLKNEVCDLCGIERYDYGVYAYDVYEKKDDMCLIYLNHYNYHKPTWHEGWVKCESYLNLLEHFKANYTVLAHKTATFYSPNGKKQELPKIERLYSKTIKVIDIKEVNGQPWVNVEFVFEEASEPDPNPEAREYPYPFKRGWLPQFNEEGKENIEVWDNYKGC